jgi:hypothetical protein
MENNNFGAFLRFFPRGLNPFKIQRKFKSQKIDEFVFQNLCWIRSLTNEQSCSSSSNLLVQYLSEFWKLGRSLFLFLKFGRLNQIWKLVEIWNPEGPGCQWLTQRTCARHAHATRSPPAAHHFIGNSGRRSHLATMPPTPAAAFKPWRHADLLFSFPLSTEESFHMRLALLLFTARIQHRWALRAPHASMNPWGHNTSSLRCCCLSRKASRRVAVAIASSGEARAKWREVQLEFGWEGGADNLDQGVH